MNKTHLRSLLIACAIVLAGTWLWSGSGTPFAERVDRSDSSSGVKARQEEGGRPSIALRRRAHDSDAVIATAGADDGTGDEQAYGAAGMSGWAGGQAVDAADGGATDQAVVFHSFPHMADEGLLLQAYNAQLAETTQATDTER